MTHPLVGVWLAEVDDATRSRVTHSYRDDGLVVVASAFHAGQGIWRPLEEPPVTVTANQLTFG